MLESYLDSYDNGEIDNNIFKQYDKFNYENEELYILHLNFMLNNLYNIKIVEPKRKRLNQKEFREEIINKYQQCVITGETCLDELTAAHIVPVSTEENYDIDNGLLLSENLHKTFDKYKWSINPETLKVEIKKEINVGTIKKYEGKILEIKINWNMKQYLQQHYNKFLE